VALQIDTLDRSDTMFVSSCFVSCRLLCYVMVTLSAHRRLAMSRSVPQSVQRRMKLQLVEETEYVARVT